MLLIHNKTMEISNPCMPFKNEPESYQMVNCGLRVMPAGIRPFYYDIIHTNEVLTIWHIARSRDTKTDFFIL